MADKNADQIKALYGEIAKLAPSQDWERILKTAKKILGFNVSEKKALHCKVVCLIHLDKFDEALTSIKNTPDAGVELVFERAYCEYRLHEIEKAYATLTSQGRELNNKEKELLAQVTYRLEKYQESYDAYRDLIKNTDDEFENERQTNLSAVVASLKNANPSSSKDLDMSEKENETYELCYNSACIALSKGNDQAAVEKLKKAEKMCIDMFHEDQPQDSSTGQVILEQSDQEALDNELAIIKVQLAYCLQKMGKSDEALKIYNSVIKTKPSDVSVMAVLNNNMVCLNKDQNVFDSKKRLKAATGAELDQKLNSIQLRTIAYNEILFSILTNQKDSVNKLLDQYKSKFKDVGRYGLLRVTQLYREKKYAEAEQILKEAIQSCDAQSASASGRSGMSLLSLLRLHLAQVLVAQGKQKESIEVFKSLDECKAYKLGVTSALVTLLKKYHESNAKAVSDVFYGAVEHFNKVDPNARELQVYVKENSSYQIANNNFEKACEMMEKMRSMRPNDTKILSKLINTYSKFNPAKAKELSKDLPTLEKLAASSNIDIDLLESQFSLMNSKYGKTKTAAASGEVKLKSPAGGLMKSPGDKKSSEVTTQKKKKKRKVILPKVFNPNVQPDPERWIPLRERSYYRGKRKKKNAVGKGTQGAVSYSAKDTPPNMTPQASSPRPGEKVAPDAAAESKGAAAAKPPQSAAAKSAQQKKNKKKGGKW